MISIAPRVASLRPSPTAEISDRIRALRAQGCCVVNLGEGELDFDTPDHIKQAGCDAIRTGDTKYTAVSGTSALKQAIAHKFARENGLHFEAAEIIAGAGAKQLIFNAFLATIIAGDEIIIPSPYWVSYPDMVTLAGGEPRIVACTESAGWKMSGQALEAAIGPRTRWVVLNSPNNPTGAVYSHAEIKALTDVLLRHPHVLVLTDDIYEHLCYGVPFATPSAVEPRLRARTLIVNGVSKAYSMTGWRLGFAAGPAVLVNAIETLQSQSTSNPSSISQAAAAKALAEGPSFIDEWMRILHRRRDIVVAALNAVPGLGCTTPDGAFYVYVNCAGLIGTRRPDGQQIRSDFDVAAYFLDAAGVGVVHGAAFGASPYVRVAYAVDDAILRDACTRIARACDELSIRQTQRA